MTYETCPEPLVIACAADDAYAPGLAVTLYSAVANCTAETVVCAVVDMGLSDRTVKRLHTVVATARSPHTATVELLFLSSGTYLQGTQVYRHFAKAAYARLLLGRLLPDVKKCIYLDCDLLVTGNVVELQAVDLGGNALAAVEGRAGPKVRDLMNRFLEGTGWSRKYFNSGVLIMDLERFRSNDIGEQAVAFCENHASHLLFPDQDALNVLLSDAWIALDSRWNMIVKHGRNRDLSVPGVLHFVGAKKPWKVARRPKDLEIEIAIARYRDALFASAIFAKHKVIVLSAIFATQRVLDLP